MELGQQAQLAGQGATGQTVVGQVQGQQVLQPPDRGGDLFQLGGGRWLLSVFNLHLYSHLLMHLDCVKTIGEGAE